MQCPRYSLLLLQICKENGKWWLRYYPSSLSAAPRLFFAVVCSLTCEGMKLINSTHSQNESAGCCRLLAIHSLFYRDGPGWSFFSRANSLSQVHVLCSYQMKECTLYVTPTHSHRHFQPIVVALWSERT